MTAAILQNVEARQLLTPAITSIGPTVNWTAGTPPAILTDSAVVTDPPGNDLTNCSMSIQLTNAAATDRLTFVPGNGVTIDGDNNISVNAIVVAVFNTVDGGTGLQVNFNDNADPAAVQAVLRQSAYFNTGATPTLFNRNVQFSITDNTLSTSTPVSKTVQVSTNPSVTIPGDPIVYTAGAPALLLCPTASVADGGNNFANSSLVVTFTAWESTDQLALRPGGGVTLNGSDVLVNGVVVGEQFPGSFGDPNRAGFTLQFNPTATRTIVQSVVRRIGYTSSISTPTAMDRLLYIQLTDGTNAQSDPATRMMQLSNSPAIYTLGAPVSYLVGSPPAILAPGATTADGASAQGANDYANSSLSVQLTNGAATDLLSLVASAQVTLNGSTISFNGTPVGTIVGGTANGTNPLVINFNGSADKAVVEGVMRRVGFSSTSNTPGTFNRTVRFQLTDGSGVGSAVGAPATKTANISNTPSVNNVGPTVVYTVGSAPVLVANQAVPADGGNNFANSFLTVHNTNGAATDRVSIVPNATVTLNGSDVSVNGTPVGSFSGGDGTNALVVAFNASTTQGIVQTVLRRVGFSNTALTPGVFNRTFHFVVTDGTSTSSAFAAKTVQVSSTPVLSGLGGNVSWKAGAAPTVLAPLGVPMDGGNNFANSVLTIQATNGEANDRLTILASAAVTLNGNNIVVNGTTVGTFGGGSGSTALTINFNASATQGFVQTVLRRIAFSSVSATPGTFNRNVAFQLTDGLGNASAVVSKQVLVTL